MSNLSGRLSGFVVFCFFFFRIRNSYGLSIKGKEEFRASSSRASISKITNLHSPKSILMEALLQKKAFKDHCRFDSKILIRIQSTQNILYGALIVTQITKTMLNE